jgi:hypothetical protein
LLELLRLVEVSENLLLHGSEGWRWLHYNAAVDCLLRKKPCVIASSG